MVPEVPYELDTASSGRLALLHDEHGPRCRLAGLLAVGQAAVRRHGVQDAPLGLLVVGVRYAARGGERIVLLLLLPGRLRRTRRWRGRDGFRDIVRRSGRIARLDDALP